MEDKVLVSIGKIMLKIFGTYDMDKCPQRPQTPQPSNLALFF